MLLNEQAHLTDSGKGLGGSPAATRGQPLSERKLRRGGRFTFPPPHDSQPPNQLPTESYQAKALRSTVHLTITARRRGERLHSLRPLLRDRVSVVHDCLNERRTRHPV